MSAEVPFLRSRTGFSSSALSPGSHGSGERAPPSGIVTSLGERKLASFPESGKRIADGGPGGTLERWRPSMFYTRKQDQS